MAHVRVATFRYASSAISTRTWSLFPLDYDPAEGVSKSDELDSACSSLVVPVVALRSQPLTPDHAAAMQHGFRRRFRVSSPGE